jgi:amino acid transporter
MNSSNPSASSPASIPKSSRDKKERDPNSGFGTFGGVFTPCTLTILGVIMFLRFGYVVGNTGLLWALGILLTAKVITVLTTLSLSAVATNTRVKGGGAYFLISRSLGVEFGGAIGVVFFLAQAISVAMYVIGFTEALVALTGETIPFKVAAVITNLVVFACVYIGAGWTIKVQYFILATLGLSLVSFFWGGIGAFSWTTVSENLQTHFVDKESLFTMFALFFPAVTGIMAGANMSGDLKNPAKSIPSGTLLAILVTAIVYALMALFLAGTRSADALVSDNLIISDIAQWPVLILAGVFAATLSSALGSMMGAPRILQALARDSIFPSLKMFRVGSGPNSEPRRAIILTMVISTIGILFADLDTIAPLITMAFMITYGTINLATFYEGITKNPSYRPTFRYSHWSFSLLGAVGCAAVMLLMNWQWALISTALMSAIYFFIYRKQVESRWGDLNSGLLFERTRKNLIKLERMLYHPKNWRPIILAMTGGGKNRATLAIFGHWLTSGYGILNLGHVIQGDIEDRVDRIINQESVLENFIIKEDLEAFPNVVAAPTITEGIEYLVQCCGLGALRPNTLLLGWPNEEGKAEAMVASLRVIAALKRNLIVAKLQDSENADPRVVPRGSIDVWWRGHQNGELMLLLGHLLKQNPAWRNRTIRLMRVVAEEAAREDVLNHLQQLAAESRIEVQARVFVSQSAQSVIAEQSRSAAISLLGFEMPELGREAVFYQNMERFTQNIPRALFVSSIGNMKLTS